MKRRPYLYFLSNAKVITEQRALVGVHLYDFATLAQNIHGIILFADGLPNHEYRESFVLRKFKRIQ